MLMERLHNFLLFLPPIIFCYFCRISGLGKSDIKYLTEIHQVTLSVKVKTLTSFLRCAAGVSLQQVISHSTMHNTLSTSISQLHCNVNLKGYLESLHTPAPSAETQTPLMEHGSFLN